MMQKQPTSPWPYFGRVRRSGIAQVGAIGATSTGAERTRRREHRTAGATTLPERISAGARRSEPVKEYYEKGAPK
jgi:hypothetical protein